MFSAAFCNEEVLQICCLYKEINEDSFTVSFAKSFVDFFSQTCQAEALESMSSIVSPFAVFAQGQFCSPTITLTLVYSFHSSLLFLPSHFCCNLQILHLSISLSLSHCCLPIFPLCHSHFVSRCQTVSTRGSVCIKGKMIVQTKRKKHVLFMSIMYQWFVMTACAYINMHTCQDRCKRKSTLLMYHKHECSHTHSILLLQPSLLTAYGSAHACLHGGFGNP